MQKVESVEKILKGLDKLKKPSMLTTKKIINEEKGFLDESNLLDDSIN